MAKREISEINAGSMADIAFLLLIFFLVTTTMDTDSGIQRILPAIPDEETLDTKVEIHERNILLVFVNMNDRLMVEGDRIDISELRDRAKEFYLNTANRDDLPEKKPVEAEYFGTYMTTPNAVISLKNDRGTSYEMYIAVQNELAAAVHELQDELSRRHFGIKYDDLDESRKKAVKLIHPMAISEAEPVNIGGK